jgi:iron complex transport system substrate-binding protein
LGRTVVVPRPIKKIAALHHFGGKIVFALGQQDKLVEQALYHKEGEALAAIDPQFAAKSKMLKGHAINIEELVSLRPDVAFVYASFDTSDMEQLENAGIRVVAVRGETLEESYQGVNLMAKVLGCENKSKEYLGDCEKLLNLVRDRLSDIPPEKRLRVMFAGPKSIYTAATGGMLQTEILEKAGAVNVAADLRGFWSEVSPEQVVAWNPDVIFLGSYLDTYGINHIFGNPQFETVKAIRERKVYPFPSNIGWWDYPAPHCVLGVVWAAKTLYPERFTDLDIRKIADDFYEKFMGHSFTTLGGKL